MLDDNLIAKLVGLSAADRLELIGAVWDSLLPASIPVTASEKALLDARLAEAEANPGNESDWESVKARLERRQT